MNYLRQIDVSGKKVLLRAEFNVSLDENNKVIDDFRIRSTIPTIKYLLEKNCRIIIMAHLGRPSSQELARPRQAEGEVGGVRKQELEKFSLASVAEKLSELTGKNVGLAPDCIGQEVLDRVEKLKNGEILLLENLRFHEEEEKNDKDFARSLAELGEVYINDAFGVSHRAHASVEAITEFLPSGAGFLLEKEILNLTRVKESPEHPFVAILGGSKISSKLKVIGIFLDQADRIILGGALANTLLYAKGFSVGASLVEKEAVFDSERILRSEKILLPQDAIVCINPEGKGGYKIGPVGQTPNNEMILDIGPKTEEEFVKIISGAKTVVWNGPMGLFEKEYFAHGTEAIARSVAESPAFSVVGGGETVAFLEKLGLVDKFDFVSTGGGAMMEFLAGEKLPGLEALERN